MVESRQRVIIMGAAGRDFHNFNVYFRDNKDYDVIAFTATQIPGIEGRKYPKELAGKLYENGIQIYSEQELPNLIKQHNIDYVFFSYSDISHENLMHKASLVLATGANFALLGPNSTFLESNKPVISVCAVRTGCGKSQTSKKIASILKEKGYKTVVVRHPMPYGNLAEQAVQRFATYEDLQKNKCTIEEREEYEPHIAKGIIVYAGVDYEKILRQAEKEADIILWDGGNNDLPFFKPDLHIVVTDPHRAGHELKYYPGETNLRLADIVIINKVNTARKEDIETVRNNIKSVNLEAKIIEAESPVTVDKPELVRGKIVLAVEDGPTLTHGEMKYGAAIIAAKENGAKEIIDPRKYAVGSLIDVYKKYNHLDMILPAMGYSELQIKELEETINRADCDSVIIGTPIDLGRLIKINKPYTRVSYELKEINGSLEDVLRDFLKKTKS